jgi:hypothetical protein
MKQNKTMLSFGKLSFFHILLVGILKEHLEHWFRNGCMHHCTIEDKINCPMRSGPDGDSTADYQQASQFIFSFQNIFWA